MYYGVDIECLFSLECALGVTMTITSLDFRGPAPGALQSESLLQRDRA